MRYERELAAPWGRERDIHEHRGDEQGEEIATPRPTRARWTLAGRYRGLSDTVGWGVGWGVGWPRGLTWAEAGLLRRGVGAEGEKT